MMAGERCRWRMTRRCSGRAGQRAICASCVQLNERLGGEQLVCLWRASVNPFRKLHSPAEGTPRSCARSGTIFAETFRVRRSPAKIAQVANVNGGHKLCPDLRATTQEIQ